jgi:transcriptional regulator with XRE-family HTH domain
MENQFGTRLSAARKMAGMSLQELADRLGNIVTKQSLNKYEKGLMKPDSELLIKIANILGVNVDYFFREYSVELVGVEFRKKSKLTKTQEKSVKEKTIDFLERYFELENILALPSDFVNPLGDNLITNNQDIEDVSMELRNAWELGLNPISNVVEMLEDNNIKVFEIEAPDSFDGLSAHVKGKPIIVINKSFDLVRRRFTALHELAHLILKFDESIDEKQIEKYEGLPKTPIEIDRSVNDGRETQVDLNGKFKIGEVNGKAEIIFDFGKWKGESFRNVYEKDAGYIEWMINKGEFTAETKIIAKKLLNRMRQETII